MRMICWRRRGSVILQTIGRGRIGPGKQKKFRLSRDGRILLRGTFYPEIRTGCTVRFPVQSFFSFLILLGEMLAF